MKRYVRRHDSTCVVQWRGEMTADVAALVAASGAHIDDERRLVLGNGWSARVGDWIYIDRILGDADTIVIRDEMFRRLYEEVDLPEAADAAVEDLNSTIDHSSGGRKTPGTDSLTKVRSLCTEVSALDLSMAIEVHRANCHQTNCPVLAAMEQDVAIKRASARRTSP